MKAEHSRTPRSRVAALSIILPLLFALPAGIAQAQLGDWLKKAEEAAVNAVKEVQDTYEQQKSKMEEEPEDEEDEDDEETQDTAAADEPAADQTPTGSAAADSNASGTAADATTITAAGSSTTQAAAGTSGLAAGEDIRKIPLVLLEIKYAPESLDDARYKMLTQQQIQSDQGVYQQADQLADFKENNPAMEASFFLPMEKRLADSMRGVVFERAEVEGREVDFAARELMPKYRQRLQQVAASLPSDYRVEMIHGASFFDYDFDNGVLYNRRGTWSPCDTSMGESCLPNGWGGHLFILGGNAMRSMSESQRPKDIAYYMFRPGKLSAAPTQAAQNPHRWPQILANDRQNISNRGYLALDRNLDVGSLKMSAGEAEAIKSSKEMVRVVIHFSLNDYLKSKYLQAAMATLQRVTLYAPDGTVLKAWQAGDFTTMAQVMAARTAKADSETAAASQAQEDKEASLTILGLELGMPTAAADQIIRKHMALATVAALEVTPDMLPKHSGNTLKFPYYHRETIYLRDNGLERITLAVSPDGSTVSGIQRVLELPENTSIDGLVESLLKKYPEPSRKQGSQMMDWGPNTSYHCGTQGQNVRPKIKTLEGVPLDKDKQPTNKAFGFYNHSGQSPLSKNQVTRITSKCGIWMRAELRRGKFGTSGPVMLTLTLVNQADYLKLHELALQAESQKNPDQKVEVEL